MNILERINQDFTDSVKAREVSVVSVLRMLRASLKNAEIEKKGDLTEEDIQSVIKKEVKQLKDSLESFKEGGREDLIEKAEKELQVLERYLPEQMSDEDLKFLVKEKISEMGDVSSADFGRVMSEVMKAAQGKADGSRVSKVVKDELSHIVS